ncbi:hypothetical protein Q8W71_16450 [Methylobacterium sp. NEAU 140]|uniref:hypothetical protein n=1 Tax=Methylobacterium sp. NEAU 140 TaxID=3064945 RepID=UPI0027375E87|nr:hypothetical protein [Methylobacterium sp. NEAU 140]MDP4024221.1 hypothetical protein [Methylobacterium sp. NEAU 140]
MRALLTSGIKAILAIAALSTAAHWALRVQRESPAAVSAAASQTEPSTTGSIDRSRLDRAAPRASEAAPVATALATAPKPSVTAGLDQTHLAALIAGATPPKPKAAKPATTKTASADKPAAEKPAGDKVAAKR